MKVAFDFFEAAIEDVEEIMEYLDRWPSGFG